MSSKHLFITLIFLSSLIGCIDRLPLEDIPKKVDFEVKRIRWTKISTYADLSYNADHTLKQINYSNPGNPVVNFFYENQKIKELTQSGSIFTTKFAYNNAGQMIMMSREIMDAPGQNRTTLKLEFTYNGYDRLVSIKNFLVNAAGSRLMHRVNYDYDMQLRPAKITSIEASGITTIVTIEAYSAPVSFNPLYFIDTGGLTIINADYLIYNYPILSRLKELPSIIKVTKVENGISTLEQQTKITYTINHLRLEKQINERTFPLTPQIDYVTVMEYDY